MMDILDVINNIHDLYENSSSLSALKDFERVLDELDMYAYDNWIDGELAYGPKIDRHWITAGFMWPKHKMPDPMAAKKLSALGCKIKYERTHIIEPRKIRTPDDFRPNTKKGKLDRLPIWIVEIQMPKKLAFDVYKGYMDKQKNEIMPADNKDKAAVAMPQPGMMPGAMQQPGMMPGGMPQPGMQPPVASPMTPGTLSPGVRV